MQLYYDTFADKVVTDINEIAPPERYIRVHCGKDVFIERWYVGDGRFVDIAYMSYDRKQGLVHSIHRAIEKKHDVSLLYMTDWTVSKEYYKRMLKEIDHE